MSIYIYTQTHTHIHTHTHAHMHTCTHAYDTGVWAGTDEMPAVLSARHALWSPGATLHVHTHADRCSSV